MLWCSIISAIKKTCPWYAQFVCLLSRLSHFMKEFRIDCLGNSGQNQGILIDTLISALRNHWNQWTYLCMVEIQVQPFHWCSIYPRIWSISISCYTTSWNAAANGAHLTSMIVGKLFASSEWIDCCHIEWMWSHFLQLFFLQCIEKGKINLFSMRQVKNYQKK